MRRFILLACLVALAGCATKPRERETLAQVSTIDSLMAGNYDGTVRLSRLYNYGDFGLGTLDRLDGELIVLDGQAWQVPVSGEARRVAPAERTPFAALTHFDPETILVIDNTSGISPEQQVLNHLDPDRFAAIRVHGRFSSLRTRSVPRQETNRPLPAVIADGQKTFDFTDVEGTMVGLYCPAYVKGLNVPGFHFHFITADRTAGGHVLSWTPSSVVVAIDDASTFTMLIPDGFAPGAGDDKALEAVEKGK
ncbi:acetolactate decarboxylase [bacterium]|nr:acetolactate decarboxylase [bacterium]